jgi:hypothetical protein
MIKKILRIIFSLVGVLLGYGIYLLLNGLIKSTGMADKILVCETQQFIAASIVRRIRSPVTKGRTPS